jgi:hypothetical protein
MAIACGRESWSIPMIAAERPRATQSYTAATMTGIESG